VRFLRRWVKPPSVVSANQHPNTEDYKLLNGTIYLHLDGSTTICQTSTGDDNKSGNIFVRGARRSLGERTGGSRSSRRNLTIKTRK
jgi:hypothetical protein